MSDTTKPISNPKLVQMLAQLHKENTPQLQDQVLDEIVQRARFITPVEPAPDEQTKGVQFRFIRAKDGRTFFPAFTDWEEMRKLVGPKDQRAMVLSFDDYAALFATEQRVDGFVINPFGTPLTLDRDIIAQLAKRKRQLDGYTRQVINKNTKVLFSEPQDYPQALVDALCIAMADVPQVERLFLRQMTRAGESTSSYLLLVDHRGQQEDVFRAVAAAARPHLQGKHVDMVPFSTPFGQAAAKDAAPFFNRKK